MGHMGTWDDLIKVLITANPQSIISFLFPGAQFLENLNTELRNPIRNVVADSLLKVVWMGLEIIVHIEFQRHAEGVMPRRVWEYNVLSTYVYQRPTLSFVVYFVEEANIPEPIYTIEVGERAIHAFSYQNVKVWELAGTQLKQPGVEGLLPLLPLTKGGATYDVVEDMIAQLLATGKQDLLPIGYSFAALVLKDIREKNWLQWRFSLMESILEQSWAYQEMVSRGFNKGFNKGFDEGHNKGFDEGHNKGFDEALVRFVRKRFPKQVELADLVCAQVTDMAVLSTTFDSLIEANSEEEAQEILTKALQSVS
jgi:hypothetical protein